MAYFLGLDSGGTKTECWLGDESQVLGRAVCGTVKLTRVSQVVATERMSGLLTEVAAQSGVSLEQVARTCVGAAGVAIADVRQWMARVVGARVGGTVEVVGDDEIALDAAFRGGAGILVIGGTGMNVVGRCSDGSRHTSGGWGPGVGDEGSGHWIGREAVRQAFHELDRSGEETGLLAAIRVAWGCSDVGEVVGVANAQPGPEYADLTRVAAACAAQGDEVAARVLASAGDELAEHVAVVWAKMGRRGESSGQVAYTGSVVEKIARVREQMERRIVERCVGLRVEAGAVNSLQGALWRARGRASGLGATVRD